MAELNRPRSANCSALSGAEKVRAVGEGGGVSSSAHGEKDGVEGAGVGLAAGRVEGRREPVRRDQMRTW